MPSKFLSVLFLLLFALLCFTCADFNVAQHLNTKSPYFIPSNNTEKNIAKCDVLHINYVARHGSREPTSGNVKSLLTLQNNLRKYWADMSNPALLWASNWTSPYNILQSALLTNSGEWEHYNISKRYLSTFNEVFNQTYYPYLFPIRTTQVSRAARSGNAFGFGLFEGKGELGSSDYEPFYTYSESKDSDYDLRFFDLCPLYTETVLDSPNKDFHGTNYLAEYKDSLIENMQNALDLSLNSTWHLGLSDIKSFYIGCAFDVAISNDTSRFCSLFSEEDIEVLEYANDLDDYYNKGYGSGIGYEISCVLLKDFFDNMEEVINGSKVEAAKLQFAHAETILPFVSLLGLFKDEVPPMWNSTQDQIDSRQWRTSIISPFAANVAFILYNCSGQLSVELTHNEVVMPFPGCSASPCPYDELRDMFQSTLSTCDLNQMCYNVTPEASPTLPSVINNGIPTWVVVVVGLASFLGGIIVKYVFDIGVKKVQQSREDTKYHRLSNMSD